MLKNIPVKINADKSITATYPYKIYQGEINTVRFIIDPSLIISDTNEVVGYIGFKRIDNQKSGFVPLKKEQDGTFTYVIKDYWTLNLVGKVWYTIKFVSISGDDKLEYQLYAGNSSFVVNPVADYIIGDDMPPDVSSLLQIKIEDLQEQINNNSENIESKLNKEFNTYPKLDWNSIEDTDIVPINRINSDGTVEQYYSEAKDLYNSVNGILPDADGDIKLYAENINLSDSDDTTVEEALNERVKYSDPIVYYVDKSIPMPEPLQTVYQSEIANRAVSDQYGNIINDTYSTKQETLETANTLNSNIQSVNNSLSSDLSDLQTQLTNMSSAIYTELQNKQDTLTTGRGISISNNVISNTLFEAKSELVLATNISDTPTYFNYTPSFTPSHYIVEYESTLINTKRGIILIGTGELDNTTISLSEFTKLSDTEFSVIYYDIYIKVGSNYARGLTTTKGYSYINNTFNFESTNTSPIYVNIYAINI